MKCFRIYSTSTFQEWPQLSLFTALVFAFFFINILNILLIIALMKTNKTSTVTTKLFIYLSFCDLITGLVTLPTQMIVMGLGQSTSCFLIGFQTFFGAFPPLQSMSTIFTMSLFRFISINKPLKQISNKSLYIILTGHFCISVIISLWYLRNILVQQIGHGMGYFLVAATCYIFLVIGSSVTMNIFLHFKLKKERKVSFNIGFTQSTRRQKNAIMTLIILTSILIICYLPNMIAYSLVGHSILTNTPNPYRRLTPITGFLMLTNSGFNSLAYILRTKKIRAYLKELLVVSKVEHHPFIDQNSVIESGRKNSVYFVSCKLTKVSEVDKYP